MAIEDIIWAKNRHMFGGMAPSNMTHISVERPHAIDRTAVSIRGEIPSDTVINGKTVCTVGGVVVRKKADGYPEDEFDGTLVNDIDNVSISETTFWFYDYIPADQQMYYAFFPYSKMGVYNRNKANRAMVDVADEEPTPTYTYLFGYDLDTANEDPTARVSYPDDVDNADYTPAVLNNLNSWNITPGEKFMPRPCMLKYDGTVDYYLDPDDYPSKEDGTRSDIADSSFEGNAMMEWSKIYTCRWEEDGIYHFRCSDAPQEDGHEWYCWCNYDSNNEEIDHFYTAIYRSSQISVNGTTRYRSLSGCTAGAAVKGNTVSTEKSIARTDDGWDMERLVDHLLIQDLLVMMGKSTDTQTVFGIGRKSSTFLSTGTADTKGLFYGAAVNDNVTTSLKIFGMEDYWGDLARRVPDIVNCDGSLFAKIPTYTENTVSIAGFGDGYTKIGTYTVSLANYISEMTTYPWGRLPITAAGSATQYECDYVQINTNTSGTRLPLIIGGGYSTSTYYIGAFTCMFSDVLSANYIGSRLSYKPTKS